MSPQGPCPAQKRASSVPHAAAPERAGLAFAWVEYGLGDRARKTAAGPPRDKH